ncbi:uncharacterized protein involved in exopolysaccharide biosynthesis [Stella humosa]|uniref:Uncharacterized protein involved in exopolysaccharide biosynthesis n=1 Tax=Stella humosa TaxID=94 RepID=A0A3N1M775_9PROT|nr:lipopolysaccharide biosynthesis protein [Stella humosa]ROQ03354.1 uncharacterized protein involved in exopolysaccharide biosynthesis [Stella humosa]BBK29641.1 LPS biosynthesis protein [Stella humosa]
MNEPLDDRNQSSLPQPAQAAAGLSRADERPASGWRGSILRKEAFTLRDLLIVAFYHRRLIIFAALLPMLVAAGAALFFIKTQYTADGLMMVLVNREVSGNQSVADTGPAVLSIEGLKSVHSELEIIGSAGVIRSTIEKVGLEKLYPEIITGRFEGLLPPVEPELRMDRAMELFRRDLRANVESDSNVVRISYRHPDRELAIKTVDTVIGFYRAHRRNIFDNPRAPFLTSEVVRFKQQLEATDADIQKLKADYNVIEIEQDRVLAANQVDNVVQRHRQVSERQAAITAQLEEAERQMAGVPKQVFDFRQRSDATANDDDRNVLTRLQLERDRLALQYAPTYPALAEIEQKIDTVRKAMRNKGDQKTFYTDREVRNPAASFLANMILSLKVERDALQNQLVELDRQRITAEKRLAELRVADGQLVEMHRRRDVLDDSYRQYVKRAEAAKIEEDAAQVRSSNVRLIQQGDAPITGLDLRLPLLVAGVSGGLLLGAAAGAFGAWLRRTFIMPTEAERSLELPVLAEFGGAGTRFDRPDQRQALAHFASIMLDTAIDGRYLRVFQLASVGDDERKRPLARALAEEFATGRQLRTLLIDFGGARDRALIPATAPGTRDEAMPVATSDVPQLWLAADGPHSTLGNLRAPLVDARRQIDQLRREYDVIVISGPAQGFSPITQRVASIVDANVLVVRGEVTRSPAAIRLRDMILEAGGGVLGTVFTGRKYYIPRWVYRWL